MHDAGLNNAVADDYQHPVKVKSSSHTDSSQLQQQKNTKGQQPSDEVSHALGAAPTKGGEQSEHSNGGSLPKHGDGLHKDVFAYAIAGSGLESSLQPSRHISSQESAKSEYKAAAPTTATTTATAAARATPTIHGQQIDWATTTATAAARATPTIHGQQIDWAKQSQNRLYISPIALTIAAAVTSPLTIAASGTEAKTRDVLAAVPRESEESKAGASAVDKVEPTDGAPASELEPKARSELEPKARSEQTQLGQQEQEQEQDQDQKQDQDRGLGRRGTKRRASEAAHLKSMAKRNTNGAGSTARAVSSTGGKGKHGKRTSAALQSGPCVCCKCVNTPLWRKGREGKMLCNACGVRWLKYSVACTNCECVNIKY